MRRVAKLELTPTLLARALGLPDGMEIQGVESHPDLFGVTLLTVEGDMLEMVVHEQCMLTHYAPDWCETYDGQGRVDFVLQWPWTNKREEKTP